MRCACVGLREGIKIDAMFVWVSRLDDKSARVCAEAAGRSGGSGNQESGQPTRVTSSISDAATTANIDRHGRLIADGFSDAVAIFTQNINISIQHVSRLQFQSKPVSQSSASS